MLIDADMRKPTVAKRFGLPAFQPGLANYLAETESLADCIVTDEKSGVDILAAGAIPLNPLELLSNPRFEALLTELKSRYSKIISSIHRRCMRSVMRWCYPVLRMLSLWS